MLSFHWKARQHYDNIAGTTDDRTNAQSGDERWILRHGQTVSGGRLSEDAEISSHHVLRFVFLLRLNEVRRRVKSAVRTADLPNYT